MAFLTVITRHLAKRSRMLQLNQLSLELQSDQDYEQVLIVDKVGLGIDAIQRRVVEYAPHIGGSYVMLLDDDDVMINANGVAAIKQAASGHPPAIIFRGWHNDLGVLPSDAQWKKPPVCGHIGSFDYALRNDVFKAHIKAFDNGYTGDFVLIDTVYRAYGEQIVWLDIIICWAIRRSLGRAEI